MREDGNVSMGVLTGYVAVGYLQLLSVTFGCFRLLSVTDWDGDARGRQRVNGGADWVRCCRLLAAAVGYFRLLSVTFGYFPHGSTSCAEITTAEITEPNRHHRRHGAAAIEPAAESPNRNHHRRNHHRLLKNLALNAQAPQRHLPATFLTPS
jgi:hypothetical protein